MAEVLDRPQFQVLTNPKTGKKTGRVYFPGLYIFENRETIEGWLTREKVHFEERDIKLYGDGSFRLYFKTSETEYKRLEQKWS
jgi:hypothetical protein